MSSSGRAAPGQVGRDRTASRSSELRASSGGVELTQNGQEQHACAQDLKKAEKALAAAKAEHTAVTLLLEGEMHEEWTRRNALDALATRLEDQLEHAKEKMKRARAERPEVFDCRLNYSAEVAKLARPTEGSMEDYGELLPTARRGSQSGLGANGELPARADDPEAIVASPVDESEFLLGKTGEATTTADGALGYAAVGPQLIEAQYRQNVEAWSMLLRMLEREVSELFARMCDARDRAWAAFKEWGNLDDVLSKHKNDVDAEAKLAKLARKVSDCKIAVAKLRAALSPQETPLGCGASRVAAGLVQQSRDSVLQEGAPTVASVTCVGGAAGGDGGDGGDARCASAASSPQETPFEIEDGGLLVGAGLQTQSRALMPQGNVPGGESETTREGTAAADEHCDRGGGVHGASATDRTESQHRGRGGDAQCASATGRDEFLLRSGSVDARSAPAGCDPSLGGGSGEAQGAPAGRSSFGGGSGKAQGAPASRKSLGGGSGGAQGAPAGRGSFGGDSGSAQRAPAGRYLSPHAGDAHVASAAGGNLSPHGGDAYAASAAGGNVSPRGGDAHVASAANGDLSRGNGGGNVRGAPAAVLHRDRGGGVRGASATDRAESRGFELLGGQPAGQSGPIRVGRSDEPFCAPCSESAAQKPTTCKQHCECAATQHGNVGGNAQSASAAMRKQRKQRGPLVCWRCKCQGHKKNECPNRGTQTQTSLSDCDPKSRASPQAKSPVCRGGGGGSAGGVFERAHSPAVPAAIASAGQVAASPNQKSKPEAKKAKAGKSREQRRTRKRQGTESAKAEAKGQVQDKAQSAKPAGKAHSAKSVTPAVKSAMPVAETVRGAVGQQGAPAKSVMPTGPSMQVKSGKPDVQANSVKPGRTYAQALVQGLTKVPTETVVQEVAASQAAVGVVPVLAEILVRLEKMEKMMALYVSETKH